MMRFFARLDGAERMYIIDSMHTLQSLIAKRLVHRVLRVACALQDIYDDAFVVFEMQHKCGGW
jgi:hypothetical protein